MVAGVHGTRDPQRWGSLCILCVWCLVVTDRGTHNTQMSFRSVDLRRVDLFVDLLVDLGGDDRWWLESTQMSTRTVDLRRVDLAVDSLVDLLVDLDDDLSVDPVVDLIADCSFIF